MGNYPSNHKVTESDADDRYWYASSAMQGWRPGMEDEQTSILELDDGLEEKNAFFAVYDGHSGEAASKYAAQHVHKRLVTEEAYRLKKYDAALKRAFLDTDDDLLNDHEYEVGGSGCTAVAALLTHDGKMYVANAGDSRSVLCAKGEVVVLSTDHKPLNSDEMARITNAGERVLGGRVNGLALSRALGDFNCKTNKNLPAEEQAVTADPETTCHDISEEDEFLVLASDGIWDCLRSQDVVDFIRLQVYQSTPLVNIPGLIFDHCLLPKREEALYINGEPEYAGIIGHDNMAMIVVALLHGRTKERWYEWIRDRVKSGYGYKTPSGPPQLYPQSDREAFVERMKKVEEKKAQEREAC